MGKRLKEESLMDMIRYINLAIILIQKTKIKDSLKLDVRKKQWKTNSSVAIRARGALGGICAL